MAIHEIIDPIWKSGKIKRADLYTKIAKGMGIKKYHTAQIRSLSEANKVLSVVQQIRDGFKMTDNILQKEIEILVKKHPYDPSCEINKDGSKNEAVISARLRYLLSIGGKNDR